MVGTATFRHLQVQERTLSVGEQIVVGKPPAWATALMHQVAADHERRDLPTLCWRWRRTRIPTSSSGASQRHKLLSRLVITIRAGKSEEDQQLVLLHELAHWLVGNDEHHSPVFYSQAFRMFAAYGDLEYAVAREGRYKPRTSREGLKLSGLEPSVIERLLRGPSRKSASAPTAHFFLTADRLQVREVKTARPLSDEERQVVEARVRTQWPLTETSPVFSVLFGRFDRLSSPTTMQKDWD